MKRRKNQARKGESFLEHNPGPEPAEPLPDTPENRARKEALWKEMSDPSTPLGAFFKEFTEYEPNSKD